MSLWKQWQRANPLLRFFASFAVLLALFYASTLFGPFEAIMRWWLRVNAQMAGAFLNACGQSVQVKGTSITSHVFSIDVRRGCDALEPMALFAVAVLAFPVKGGHKLIAILIGLTSLAALNQVRILSLFFIGLHWPAWFDTAHTEIWQLLFIGYNQGGYNQGQGSQPGKGHNQGHISTFLQLPIVENMV